MAIEIPKHYEEAVLPGYSIFRFISRGENQGNIPLARMEDMGYVKGSRAKFNAFARRFRVACSLGAIEFIGYGEHTAKGYAALNRHFLMYSALERYIVDCEGLSTSDFGACLKMVEDKDFSEVLPYLKSIDENGALWDFIMGERENTFQRSSLLSFRNGFKDKNALYLSAMLRNTFVHGSLTATPKGTQPGTVEKLALYMTELLRLTLIADFSRRLLSVLNKLELQVEQFDLVQDFN